MAVKPGLSGSLVLTVAKEDTAEAIGSGDVPVLGTPRVVALAEEACVRAVEADLDDGMTTVGMRVELTHLLPVPVGKSVKAEATLERVEGRRITFTVSVTNDQGLVAAGKITRAMVNRSDFIDKVC